MTTRELAFTATSIGTAAATRLEKGKVRYVHSIFSKAVNLVTDDGLVCVVRGDVGRGPINLVLSVGEGTRLDAFGIGKGMRLSRKGSILNLGPGVASVHMDCCEEYSSPPLPRGTPVASQAATNLGVLRKEILAHGNLAGLGALLPFLDGEARSRARSPTSSVVALARPRIVNLIEGIEAARLDAVRAAARGLVGLGPGLTPAADDLLAGLMIALLRAVRAVGLDEEFAKATNASICSAADGRTTLLSRELLRLASIGEGSEHTLDLADRVLFGTPFDVESAARKELMVGATSGTDTALGVYLGMKAGLSAARGSQN